MYPPGPFPPNGRERDGVIDLGVRLRDGLYTRETVIGPVRRVLLDQARRLAANPERLVISGDQIESLIDTWPLGALVDEARVAWTAGPDPSALAVLARCTEVIGPVLGWPRTVDRRWPLPDESWIRQHLDEGVAYAVVPRGPRDGSAAVSVAAGLPVAPAEPVALPALARVHADELVARVDELVERIELGEIAGVELDGAIPHDADTVRARRRLRDAAPRQRALDRYGLAGLLAGEMVDWGRLLDRAPAGTAGERPHRVCDALVLPSLDDEGHPEDQGVLAWDGPFKPVRVHPAAVEVLSLLDGRRTAADVARATDAPVDVIDEIVRQLVEIGAASAA